MGTSAQENFLIGDDWRYSTFNKPGLAYNSRCGHFLVSWAELDYVAYAVAGNGMCADLPVVSTGDVTNITGVSAITSGGTSFGVEKTFTTPGQYVVTFDFPGEGLAVMTVRLIAGYYKKEEAFMPKVIKFEIIFLAFFSLSPLFSQEIELCFSVNTSIAHDPVNSGL